MGHRAIETRYKGYRFRSRLEARWAVFFDALGLPWEYEPEGFELPGGGRYLPDFWLKHSNTWVEIKACQPTTAEWKKLSALCENKGSGLFLIGVPGEEKWWAIDREGTCLDYDESGNSALMYLFNYGEDANRAPYAQAVAAARGARFEFGESGAAR